jgi:hypothetical protein
VSKTKSNLMKENGITKVILKVNNGKLTDHQGEFLEAVTNVGGVAFVARSVEEIRIELEKLGILSPQKELFGS